MHRSERAEINAAPNLPQFWNFGTTPGTYVVAVPPTTEPAALLVRFSFSGSCTNGGVRPFENDRFVGQQQSWLDCGGATLRFVNIAARARDKAFTMFLQVGQPIPDDEELNRIVASAGAAPGAVFPPPSLSVPKTWRETDGFTNMNDDGTDRLRLTASTDIDGFYSDWRSPGAVVVAFPFSRDPSVLLRNLGLADRCVDGGVQRFDDGTFSGLMQTWTDCGGTVTRNVNLAISPADRSATLFVRAQLLDAGDAPLQVILSSLRLA